MRLEKNQIKKDWFNSKGTMCVPVSILLDRSHNKGGNMKYIRKGIKGIIIFMSLLSLTACATGDETGQSKTEESVMQDTQNANPDVTDESNAERQEYIYPSEFSMGDNLKAAITQLALSYENFDKDSVNSQNWKESFVANFIQNSRMSFDYLDMISEKNDGQISTDELNYIQYSLTNTELNFSSYAEGFINRNDSASSLNYGWISGYDYEYTNSGVVITANLEVGYDGTDAMQEREITAELVKNPYSCFDGYSVVTVSSKAVTPGQEPDSGTHIFSGTDMMDENNGVFTFEFLYSEDELGYKHFVYVDMAQRPELADFVRQNAGKNFRVTFIWNEGNSEAVEKVVPVDISLDE